MTPDPPATTPFAPPSGALPPRAGEPAPPPPPAAASVLPPPTGMPIGTPLYAAPPPPPKRRWLIPVILGGALVLVGLIVGVAFLAIQLATSFAPVPYSAPIGELDELQAGDPGSPVAVDPLECTVCFDIDDAHALELPSATYAGVGLAYDDDEVYEISAGDDQVDETKWWNADGGTPDSCYFTYTSAPLFFAPGAPADPLAESDIVYYPEWHFDASEYYSFSEAVRVFDQSASAVRHLTELESAIAGCPRYTYTETGWSTADTATPALDLPDSVAAYGWAESDGYTRYYAVDLQRGNLVARLTLLSDPDGPSEADFRNLVEAYAVLLGELEPAG